MPTPATSQHGPRDTTAVLGARYWLTDKGEAAIADICVCPDGHDAHTLEGAVMASYCPTHGEPS